MDAAAVSTPTVLTAEAIARLAPMPLGTLTNVTHRVLWSHDSSMAGVLSVAGGHRLGAHTHRVNHHHIWVLEGRAVVLGTDIGPGAYVHVPAGMEHDIDATASEGCTVFYLHLRPAA